MCIRDSSKALLKRNKIYLEKKDFTPEDASHIEVQSKLALLGAPLNYESFLDIAQSRNLIGEGKRHRALFDLAHRRNKRSSKALKELIVLELQNKEFIAAIKKIDMLFRRKSTAAPKFIPILSLLSKVPNAREEIDRYLKSSPIWGLEYLGHEISNLVPETIDTVTKSLGMFIQDDPDSDSNLTLQAQFFSKLILLGYEAKAFELWTSMPVHKGNIPIREIYNGDFTQNQAPAPYNWSFKKDQNFYAEIDRAGGLYASFKSDTPEILAEQYVHLNPGKSYTLSTNARWTYKERQGYYAWTLTCLDELKSFGALILNDDLSLIHI